MFTKTINPEDWLTALRESGFRVTTVQETLIDIFAHSEHALSAGQVWDIARQSRPQTGRATVYRTVDKLESLGLLRRVHGYEGCSRFISVPPEPLMLFICLDCGRADYLDRQPFNALVDTAQQASGHRIQESRIQLSGICAGCLELPS
jgi:Fe2+ or Zn2+ uptake regulation protein